MRVTEQSSLIWTKAEYKAEISSAIVYVKKSNINPEVCLALASVYIKNNMYFSLKRAGSLSSFKEGIIS